MCLGLVDAQAFQQPAKLLRAEAKHFLPAPRPLVSAAFQALVQQDETIRIPVQRLKAFCPSAAEKKQGIGERIQLEVHLDDAGQTVDSQA